MKKKIEHDYTCDVCGKPAEWNIQNAWHTYFIEADGTMVEEDTCEGDVNEFYCDKHKNN